MDIVAHIGHWWMYPLYAVPVAIVLISAAVTTVRERRTKRERDQAAGSPG